jgi:hypothetical protein
MGAISRLTVTLWKFRWRFREGIKIAKYFESGRADAALQIRGSDSLLGCGRSGEEDSGCKTVLQDCVTTGAEQTLKTILRLILERLDSLRSHRTG